MKTFIYFLGAIIVLAVLFMGGCRMMSKHIFNQQDCKRFVIDNIELRTGIDIPPVLNSTCACSEGTKDVEFTLNLKSGKMANYIERNKFNLQGKKFITTAEYEHTKWLAILDTTSQQLNIHIDYKR